MLNLSYGHGGITFDSTEVIKYKKGYTGYIANHNAMLICEWLRGAI